jgi:hypothetical protein
MLHCFSLRAALALLVLLSNSNAGFAANDSCNASYGTREFVTKIIFYENPIYINTFVETNTTFAVNDYLTVTVENAPTSFDLLTVGTSKSTIVNTQAR